MYDISVLSNIPLSVCDVIDPAAPVQRLRPLFCIGVHDISYLLEHQAALKRGVQDGDHDDATDSDDTSSGWVACTTDSILAMKEGLWDMLITMPPPYSSNATQRIWPTVEYPKGVPLKATQRDLRRFRTLSLGLARLAAAATQPHPHPQPAPPNARSPRSDTSDSPAPPTPAIRLSKPSVSSSSRPGTAGGGGDRPAATFPPATVDDTDTIVEPTTWAALAYNGFMWWASAGEKRHSDEVDEQAHDASLLADLAPPVSPVAVGQGPGSEHRRRPSFGAVGGSGSTMVSSLASLAARSAAAAAGSDGADGEEEEEEEEETQARIELAVVAYFHRLTTAVMSVMADIVDSTDEDDLLGLDFDHAGAEFDGRGPVEEGEEEEEQARLLGRGGSGGDDADESGRSRGWVRVDSEALAEMGLDVWSQGDADFVAEVAGRYFGRRAYVETKGVEVCGVRVC